MAVQGVAQEYVNWELARELEAIAAWYDVTRLRTAITQHASADMTVTSNRRGLMEAINAAQEPMPPVGRNRRFLANRVFVTDTDPDWCSMLDDLRLVLQERAQVGSRVTGHISDRTEQALQDARRGIPMKVNAIRQALCKGTGFWTRESYEEKKGLLWQ